MKILREQDFASADSLFARIAAMPLADQLARQDLAEERARCIAEKITLTTDQDALLSIAAWFFSFEPPANVVLKRNDVSRLYKLQSALRAQEVYEVEGPLLQPAPIVPIGVLDLTHSFVVQHDWFKAFESATDFNEGDVRLPYDSCAFEFVVNDRAIIAVNIDTEAGPYSAAFVQSGDRWYGFGGDAMEDYAFVFVRKQVRAICIALDAEIAAPELVRAPEKLNAARLKAGKRPLFDYHIVKLNGRHKKADFDGGGTHRSPRLHFRRGHWRHYGAHKTWIRWTLVGDPDLGYIDKHYGLRP